MTDLILIKFSASGKRSTLCNEQPWKTKVHKDGPELFDSGFIGGEVD